MKEKSTITKVEEFLDKGKNHIFLIIKEDPNIIYRLLADATNKDLSLMVAFFRGTTCWDKFLRALLGLPQEMWLRHALEVEQLCFEGKEIEQIIGIYYSMGTDVKARAILFDLNYDKYWRYRIEKAAEMSIRTAQAELRRAHDGINIVGIPIQASKKCLEELKIYVNSLEKRGSRE